MVIATNNGSFPWTRPAGETSPDGAVLDRITRETIELQARAGLDLLTDGLVRRTDPVSQVAGHLDGVTLGERREGFPGSGAFYRVPIVAADIAWKGPILCEDFLFARDGSPKPVKPVLTGPYTLARLAEDRAYDDRMALAMALAIALNQELRALQTAGATWLQIDEPALLQSKEDFPLFTRLWEVLGRGIGAEMCLHLEGGDISGLYPGIARLKRIACLSLDCVRGRASLGLLEGTPFPDTLKLSLGLVDGRATRVETPDEIRAVLEETRGLPPSDRLLLGTASDLGGLPVPIASAKLQSLVQVRDLGI
jgi:5-methyltetrahydropteroyltriglutamate--homocysteine methyltransferase